MSVLYLILFAITFFAFYTATGFFILLKNRRTKKEVFKKEHDTRSKTYETFILSKLSDEMGYSLNVQNIIEIITSSLQDFVKYDVVSYMIPFSEKIIFKAHIETAVSRKFLDFVKIKILDYLSGILKTNFENVKIEETLWGIALGGEEEFSGSFFNIPLVISGKLEGVINVASTRPNFFGEKEISDLYKITEQACQAVSRLREVVELEKSHLNAMVESMTDGVIMVDMDYKVMAINPAAKKAVAFENKNDLSLMDFANALAGKIDLKDKIEETIRLEKDFFSEEFSLPGGVFKIVISPVKNKWRALGCVVVFRDITREKEVEKIKEDFTSMIVHELRSPLDSIKKMTETMRMTEVKKASRKEVLQMIYASSSDMLELVNNLLDIAKIEAGKFELAKQKSDIKKIIQSRVLFFDITAKDAKINLTSCLAKNLPDEAEFDPRTISQVLNNFISNSLKFTKENGEITIQALFHEEGEDINIEAENADIKWLIKNNFAGIPNSLVVAVTDNGAGIAENQIGKLFNKFSQAKNTFVEKGGTGLGLAICKSIVESHGGTVGVYSIEGEGSTFYFTLPI